MRCVRADAMDSAGTFYGGDEFALWSDLETDLGAPDALLPPSYDPQLNCHFPAALKQEGAEYIVSAAHVRRSVERPGRRSYYRVSGDVSVVNTADAAQDGAAATRVKLVTGLPRVFEEPECVVCMDRVPQVIFVPCAHFVCCGDCSLALSKCPICSGPIQEWATPDETR